MSRTVKRLLAAAAAVLMVAGVGAMTAGELAVAGLCFLSASVLIYLRETRT